MLLRGTSKVQGDTFDAIFKNDINELKRKAACSALRNDRALQAEVCERVNRELEEIHESLVSSTTINLSAHRHETLASVNVASGLLDEFTFDEPKETFELEEDFQGNAKEILM